MTKTEKIIFNLPGDEKEWLSNNQTNHDCDNVSAFLRLIIRDFKKRVESGEASKNTACSFSYANIAFVASLILPIFLFVMGRVNNNDIALYSIGIISLAGPVILYILGRGD